MKGTPDRMKTLIVALNSKYIHSALAPWYLKAACGAECGIVEVLEKTINETMDDLLASIYVHKPDVIAFSCYIWNIGHILKLAESLKKLLPDSHIILGGPEVSFNQLELLNKYSFVDYIISGEGEEAIPALLKQIAHEKRQLGRSNTEGSCHAASLPLIYSSLAEVPGLSYRDNNGIKLSDPAVIRNLDTLRSPYTDEMLSSLKNRIVYFETSRGCPFSCSYCLSSATEGVRYFSLDKILPEMDRLISYGVKQIKFVDRTFNAHKERSKTIIRHIMELDRKARESVPNSTLADATSDATSKSVSNNCRLDNKAGLKCNFHFEVGADLFDDELIELLKAAPKGLFQIEAGVQTTNNDALNAVIRKTDIKALMDNLTLLRRNGNVHIHADLIAGLPYEDYSSFGHSFDDLYNIRPHQLQLGFLKLLKGTRLAAQAADNGCRYTSYPPYEVLCTSHISFDELTVLKGIAELVERYYNSSKFVYSLDYLINNCFASPFKFFESFYKYNLQNGYMDINIGLRQLFSIISNFAAGVMEKEDYMLFSELLRLDFLASDNTGTLPEFMEKRSDSAFNDKCYNYIKSSERVEVIIPDAAGMLPRQFYKRVHFDRLNVNISYESDSFRMFSYSEDENSAFLFNYMSKDSVTGRYPFYCIQL